MPIQFFKQIKFTTQEGNLRITPSNCVSEHIEGFYFFSANELKEKELLYNDGFPAVVFMDDIDSKSRISIDGEYTTLDSVWICGGELRNAYIHFETPEQHLFIVRFKPASFFQIFGLPASVFKHNPVINLNDVLQRNAMSFITDFYSCSSLQLKIACFESLIFKIGTNSSYPPLLRDALEFIDNKKGSVSVQDVLKKSGTKVNHKWLGRNFQKFIGISPQKYILLQRFLNAYIHLDNTQSHNLMDVAIENGYYDYNHFLKDFKRYAGTTPGLYFSRTENKPELGTKH